MADTLEGADPLEDILPEAPNVDDLIGEEQVYVRWKSGTRATIGGKPRYRADTFFMPASEVEKYGSDLEILRAPAAQ